MNKKKLPNISHITWKQKTSNFVKMNKRNQTNIFFYNKFTLLVDDTKRCLALFLCELLSLCLFKLGKTCSGFAAKQATSPMTTDLILTIVEVCFDCFNNLCEISSVSRINLQKQIQCQTQIHDIIHFFNYFPTFF